MKNKFVTRVAAGALTLAMAATTVAGGCCDVYGATKTGAVKKVVTVSTQKELNAALKNDNVKRVIIKTKKAANFKISSASYGNKKLTINAPKATVVNKGDFKSVTVNDAKKFTEKGEGNTIVSKDPNKLELVIPAGVETASVKVNHPQAMVTLCGTGSLENVMYLSARSVMIAQGITVEKLNVAGDAKLKVNGTVNEISVDKVVDLKISGSTTTAPKVVITEDGAGSAIVADTKVDVKADFNVDLKLNEGAKGSTVEAAEGVTPKIENKTGEEVKTSGGSSGDDAKKDTGKSDSASGSTSGSSSSSSGSSGSSSSGSGSGSSSSESGSKTDTTSGSSITTGSAIDPAPVTPAAVILNVKLDKVKEVKSGDTLTATVTSGATDVRYKWYRGTNLLRGGISSYTVTDMDEGSVITVKVTAKVDGKEYTEEASTEAVASTLAGWYASVAFVDAKDATTADALAAYLNEKYDKIIIWNNGGVTASAIAAWATPSAVTVGENALTGTFTLPDGWTTSEGTSIFMYAYVQGSEELNLTFSLSTPKWTTSQNGGNEVFVHGYATDARDVTLTVSLPEGVTGSIYCQEDSGWKECTDGITLPLADMITEDTFATFRTKDGNETTYSFIFDWKKLEVTNVTQDEKELDLGSFVYGTYTSLSDLTTMDDEDNSLVLPELIYVNDNTRTPDFDWKAEKKVNGRWTEMEFDGSVGEWRFTPDFGKYVTVTCEVKPYTMTITKETQTAPTFEYTCSISFDTVSKATVDFIRCDDLDKLEFAIFKSDSTEPLTTYKANADEVAAARKVTIGLTDATFAAETEYIVKARYAATENTDASEWTEVAKAKAPKWITNASLSSYGDTRLIGDTSRINATLNGCIDGHEGEIEFNTWSCVSYPEGAGVSNYDKAGEYVWKPGKTGYGFAEGAPQYTVTVTDKIEA